jgi:hypothetical protein
MSIISVLASLHKLKPAEIGLGDYGSSAPFYPRQIRFVLSRRCSSQTRAHDCMTVP